MSLVHVWKRDFMTRAGIIAAEIERVSILLPAVIDLGMKTVHPAEKVNAIVVIAPDSVWEGLEIDTLNAVFTIEDQPEFLFAADRYDIMRHDGTRRTTAIPFVISVRRSILPDWYVPDPEFLR